MKSMTAFEPTPLRPDTPAFPATTHQVVSDNGGMTARQHAAIALRVPDSGSDWLDEMIIMRLKMEMESRLAIPVIDGAFAEKLLARPCPPWEEDPQGNARFWADARTEMRRIEAESLLAERSAK